MKIRSIAFAATLAAIAIWPNIMSAQTASSGGETIKPAFQNAIPNLPGKSLVGLVVSYTPGGSTRAHYHPRSSFVTGFVLYRCDPKQGG